MAESRIWLSQQEVEGVKTNLRLPENGDPRMIRTFTALRNLSLQQRKSWVKHLEGFGEMSREQEKLYRELLDSLQDAV